jgi:hypothetical protein
MALQLALDDILARNDYPQLPWLQVARRLGTALKSSRSVMRRRVEQFHNVFRRIDIRERKNGTADWDESQRGDPTASGREAAM